MKSRATLYISCMFSAFLISDVPLQIKLALCKQQLRLYLGVERLTPWLVKEEEGMEGGSWISATRRQKDMLPAVSAHCCWTKV